MNTMNTCRLVYNIGVGKLDRLQSIEFTAKSVWSQRLTKLFNAEALRG